MILYVLQFNNWIIKVGKTTQTFNARLRSHRSKERPIKIIRTFHCQTQLKEHNLILFCKRKGRLVRGNEWFRGVLFEDIVEYLQKHNEKVEPKITPIPIQVKISIKRKQLKPKIIKQIQATITKDKKKRMKIAQQKERLEIKKISAKKLLLQKKCQPVRTLTPPKQMPWTCSLHRHKEFSKG